MSLLSKKDHTHPDPRVRLLAVADLMDADLLTEIACTDDSPRVRLTAVSRLKDDVRLEKVARTAKSLDARLVAVERIFSQRVIADLLKDPRSLELTGMCFSRLSDRDIIRSIAESAEYSPVVRRLAVEHFADEAYLAEAVEAAEKEPARKTDEAIDRYLEAYGGGMRGDRAIGRFLRSEKALRALGTIARRGGECGGLAIEYLCTALGSANPKLSECAADELAELKDAELVDCLIRALDRPTRRQPIRGVLERIDTPEARAALAQFPDGE